MPAMDKNRITALASRGEQIKTNSGEYLSTIAAAGVLADDTLT
jgi:hypothetical protein